MLVLNYQLEDLFKYGFLSFVFYFSFISVCGPVTYFGVKYFIIIVIYCLILIKSQNNNIIALTRSRLISPKLVHKVLSDYNKKLTVICSFNEFWRKVYSKIIYGFTPFIMICLQQTLFERLNHILYIGMFFTITFATIFMFSLNIMASQIFQEVMRTEKIVYKLLDSMKYDSNARLNFKVN